MPGAMVNGVRIWYQETGAGAPVVQIHGAGFGHFNFATATPILSKSFRCIDFDMRGYGQSERPFQRYDMEVWADDVAGLMDHLGLRSAHIHGTSMGGMVAQQFALDYPYATASLVLADTVAGLPAGAEAVVREQLRFIEDNPMHAVATARITNAFSDAVDPVMRGHMIEQVALLEKQHYLRAARAVFGFSVTARLAEIAAPTLVIAGEAERTLPLPLIEDLAARIRGARLVRIPGAGHISNLERPQEFNRAVLEFLAAQG